LQHCGRSLSGNPHESAVPCVRRRRFVCLSPWTIRCLFLATSSATNGRVAPSPHGGDRSFQRPEGIAPFRSFLTLRERPPQSRQEVGMPHALAVVARLVATFSLLVVPALALFLLSLGLRRRMSRDSHASARQVPSGWGGAGSKTRYRR